MRMEEEKRKEMRGLRGKGEAEEEKGKFCERRAEEVKVRCLYVEGKQREVM